MINQVTLEGYVVSRWQYKGEQFLRIAHHRELPKGQVTHSDYVTVRVDAKAEDVPKLQQGDLVRVSGEVWGKDILEPLGRIIQKARLNVELTSELENLIVPRPTTYILAQHIHLLDALPPARQIRVDILDPTRQNGKPGRHGSLDADLSDEEVLQRPA